MKPGKQNRAVQQILDLLPEEKRRALAVQDILIFVDDTVAEEARRIQQRQAEYRRKAGEIHAALPSTDNPINLDLPTDHPNAAELQRAMDAVENANTQYERDATTGSERLVNASEELASTVRGEIETLLRHLRTVNSRLENISKTLTTYFSFFTDDTVTANGKIIEANNRLIAELLDRNKDDTERTPSELAFALNSRLNHCKILLCAKSKDDYDTFKEKTMGMLGTHYLEADETPGDFTFSKTEVMLTTLIGSLRIPYLADIDISNLREDAEQRDDATADTERTLIA